MIDGIIHVLLAVIIVMWIVRNAVNANLDRLSCWLARRRKSKEMTQAQLKEMAARYRELQTSVDLVDEELSNAVGGVWFSCDVCGDVGPCSSARSRDSGGGDCCLKCCTQPGGKGDE